MSKTAVFLSPIAPLFFGFAQEILLFRKSVASSPSGTRLAHSHASFASVSSAGLGFALPSYQHADTHVSRSVSVFRLADFATPPRNNLDK